MQKMQYIEQPTDTPVTEQPVIPTQDFSGWGEVVGTISIGLAVLTRYLLVARPTENKLKERLIEELKQKDDEIEELKNQNNRLRSELFLIRRTMELSGENSPPGSKKRVMELRNKNANSQRHD